MSSLRRPTELARDLAPLDILTVLYTACSFLVLSVQAFGNGALRLSPAEFGWLLTAHALLIALVLLASQARRERCSTKPCLLAEWYPLVVLTAVYGSVDLVNAPRAAAGLSYDAIVQNWEAATFGRQLAYDWSRSRAASVVSWPLSLSYLLFFPLVVIAPAVLWWRGHIVRARQTIFGVSLAFLSCYLIFLVFPVAGPTYLWGWPMDGAHAGTPARLVRDLIEGADSWGSAFPSSHVAASMAAVILAFRNWRPLGWVLLPFALGILIGVVYFQVHYAVDAIAGLVIAGFATAMAVRLIPADSPAT